MNIQKRLVSTQRNGASELIDRERERERGYRCVSPEIFVIESGMIPVMGFSRRTLQ